MSDATIRDVARRAQVSVASVSRVLNRLENVSAETRARVADAVRELGYVPHAGARSLSLARTNAIASEHHGDGHERQAINRFALKVGEDTFSTCHNWARLNVAASEQWEMRPGTEPLSAAFLRN